MPDLRFSIHLNNAPHILTAAAATHGRAGRATVERYRLAHLWCFHVYRYHAKLLVNGNEFSLYPGSATLLAPNTDLEYRFNGLSPHWFVHFAMPEAEAGDESWSLPAFFELGADLARIETAMERIGDGTGSALRKEVLLWDVLWELADREAAARRGSHPSLEKARMLIDLRLGEPLSVAALARECGLSHNHLTRLFQKELGTSVIAYIRGRRVERACHLLEQSSLPPKAIAMQVGVPDARQFWALIKRETGKTPKEWQGRG